MFYSLIHEPSVKFAEYSAFIGVVCFVAFWFLIWRLYYDTRYDIYRQRNDFLLELYSVETLKEKGIRPHGRTGTLANALTPSRLIVFIASIILFPICSWYSYRSITLIRLLDGSEESFLSKEYDSGLVDAKHAIRIDSKIRKAHLVAGKCLLGKQRPVEAIPELVLAAQNDRADPEVHVLLGDTLLLVNRGEEAIPEYNAAIAIAPKLSSSYVRLGSCLATLGRIDDSITELRYAISLDSRNVKAICNLGMVLLSAGHTQAGIEQLKQATALEPQNVAAHNTLAIGYANVGLLAESAAEFRSELALDPDFTIGYFNLATILRKMGDTHGAIEAFESYLRKCTIRPEGAVAVPAAREQIAKLKAQLTHRNSH